jgi:hypothetical protein
MKNSNDTIGNRTRDLPACSAVPQQTAPPRAPIEIQYDILNIIFGKHLNARFQREGSVLLLLTSVILIMILLSVMSIMVLMHIISVLVVVTSAYVTLTLAFLATAMAPDESGNW